MAYPTLSGIKERLDIDGTDQDAPLQSALAAARGAVENYCGYRWEYPDYETRVFELYDTAARSSVFDISDPGLLTMQHVRAWLRWDGAHGNDVGSSDYFLRRLNPRGVGPYDRIVVKGARDFCEVRGIFGRGLTAPDEVAECVMLVAMELFREGTGQVSSVDDEVRPWIFEDNHIHFLLRGHRRYR